MNNLTRYSIIKDKFSREFILLQGTGCKWKKCTFCDYYKDISINPFKINKPIIKQISGVFGVLDVINSGSCTELDEKTICLLKKIVNECNINTIWFEAHFMYRNKLDDFRKQFAGINVKFRIGVETFNPHLRDLWKKGIPEKIKASNISEYFNGVCLLVGIKGQTADLIKQDIKLALKYFEYASINVFTKNSTNTIVDENLITTFKTEILPNIKDNPKIEVLLNNKDLGVG